MTVRLPWRALARWEILSLAVVLAAFAVTVARAILVRAPLEFDEAVYAVKARAWVEDGPDPGWSVHRQFLLPALASLVVRAGGGDVALRVIALAIACAVVLVCWGLARAVFGPAPAAVAAAVFATAPTVAQRASQFLTDLPAAGFLLAVALATWSGLEPVERPRARLLLAAPAAAGAFYCRYGSLPALLSLGIVALVIWWPKVRRAPLVPLATVALFLGLLAPHLVYSIDLTGSPWGVVVESRRLVRLARGGFGIPEYVAGIPAPLAGPLAGAVMLAGLVSSAAVFARARRGLVDAAAVRATAFVAVPAVGGMVLLGLSAHAEPRFVFFPIALLITMGSAAVVAAARGIEPARATRAGAAVLAVAAIASWMWVQDRTRAAAVRRSAPALVGQFLASAPKPCGFIATTVPVIAWYSGCDGVAFGDPRTDGEVPPPGVSRFVVIRPGLPGNPDAAEAAALLERLTVLERREVAGANVYRVR